MQRIARRPNCRTFYQSIYGLSTSWLWCHLFGVGLVSVALAKETDGMPVGPATALPAGIRPTAESGRILNLDFENGTLDDWTATGEAFAGQPVAGNTVSARRRDMASDHDGHYWIGTYERRQDEPVGTLTSVPFRITQPWASFLVGGGTGAGVGVELIAEDGTVFARQTGADRENMRLATVDLSKRVGQKMQIRLVDQRRDGWGHVNFDRFRFHEHQPVVPASWQAVQPDRFAHAGLDPKAAASAMTVPPGFQVTLAAAEPDVQQPIALAIDDRGRLWVAEAYSYPRRVPENQAKDRILIFEDTDGDGKFDRRQVFADRLNLVSGIEVGFGGVWVGAAPHFLFIPDRNGDDQPDGPAEILLDGWGYQDTHETLNSFIWGPDGWLYGCHGVFTHSKVGKPGTPVDQRAPLNAGIWRYHPTRHEFEVFAWGTSNPWGVDFDERGQAVLTCCVIPHLFHVIQGARYTRQAGPHFDPYLYDDINTIAKHRHFLTNVPHLGNGISDAAGGGHAHCGCMIYQGGTWPATYHNQVFMNNIHGSRLNVDQIAPNGSGLIGDRSPDFLFANDAWSQFINLRYGPDGNVWLIDWYDRNQCHHHKVEGHDRSNGRIFQIRHENTTAVTGIDLRQKTDLELAQLQLHPNDWYCRHARRILQERGSARPIDKAAVDFLVDLALPPSGTEVAEPRRLRALWCLHTINVLQSEHWLRAWQDHSEFVRAWAIQLFCDELTPVKWAQLTEASPPMDLATVGAKSPVVRLYVAAALQRLQSFSRKFGEPEVTAALDRLQRRCFERFLANPSDAQDHNLPLMYWYALEPFIAHDPANGLALASAGFIPLLQEYAVRRTVARGDATAWQALMDSLQHAVDELQAAPVAAQPRFRNRLQRMLTATVEACQALRQIPMPIGWAELYHKLQGLQEERVLAAAAELAVRFGEPQALRQLRERLTNRSVPLPERRRALAALVQVRATDLATTLHELLSEAALRPDVLRALGAVGDATTPVYLLQEMGQFADADRNAALYLFANRPAWAEQLLHAFDQGLLDRRELTADLVRQLRNLNSPTITQWLQREWGLVRDTAADRQQLISEYDRMLQKSGPTPDPSLGRAVFAKSCQQCHRLFGVGSSIGPEITGSNRMNREYLLTNIIDPHALIGKDYQAHLVALADGRVLTGLIKGEDQQSITVVTANETLIIPKAEVEDRQVSDKSMMPDDLLKPFTELEVRSLFAYLQAPAQVPLRLTKENVGSFFNGTDLTNWTGNENLWKVENGEIVGTSTGLKRNEFLRSAFLLRNFRLKLQVRLKPNSENSGIQFRSQEIENGLMKGYQADIGKGWWGKLYHEHGRGLLWDKSGEAFIKEDDWNDYEILAREHHIETFLNGQPCVNLDDPQGELEGIIGLQLHLGGPMEVRFRRFQLELLD